MVDIDKKRNLVNVYGKVSRVNQHEGNYYTTVILPSASEFEDARKVSIKSQSSLKPVGDMLDITCQLGGYESNFQKRDGSKASKITVSLHAL